MIRIALVQRSLVWEKVQENLLRFDEDMVLCDGCDIIILPEMFTSGFTMKGKDKVAVHAGMTIKWMGDWAKKNDALVMGSVICEENGCYFNRFIAAFPDGNVSHYDKRHLFTMGDEKDHFMPGNARNVFQFRGITVATFICYDLRFPVWSRNTEGYDLAVYVANWPEARRDAWNILLRARAIENQAFVAGVNCVGEDGCGLRYSGDSMLVDPKGQVAGSCEEYKEEVKFVDVDPDSLRKFRAKFPVLEDMDKFIIQ